MDLPVVLAAKMEGTLCYVAWSFFALVHIAMLAGAVAFGPVRVSEKTRNRACFVFLYGIALGLFGMIVCALIYFFG